MKKSYANCDQCPLKDQHLVLGETNCKKLKSVDVLILAEAPAVDEKNEGRPLCGKAGKIFRDAFAKSGLNEENYFISNICLCTNLYEADTGRIRTTNPPDEAKEICKANWNKFLELMQPKVIFGLGGSVSEVLGLGKEGITKKRGNFFKYNDYDVFLTIHPSLFNHQGGYKDDKAELYISEFKKVKEFVSSKKEIATSEIYSFKYPEWTMDENLVLIDVQRFKEQSEICFAFMDVLKNEKKYYIISDKDYYYYNSDTIFGDSPMIAPMEDINVNIGHPEMERLYGEYEGDVRTEVKHAIDFKYQREMKKIQEKKYKPKVMFFDLEVYNEGAKSFPDPRKAEKPINSISFKVSGQPTKVFVTELDSISNNRSMELPDDAHVEFFKDERSMLMKFIKEIHDSDVYFLSGWNVIGFDIPTLFGRMSANMIPLSTFSPIGRAFFNVKRYGDFYIGGLYVIDQLELFKELSYQVESSYKLSAIAQKVLGKDKVAYEGTLDILYETDLQKFIEYSKTDTDLLEELDEALGHIALKQELIGICSTTWKIAEVTTGLVDPLILSYAKRSGLVCRSASGEVTEDKIPGAYVRKPVPGIHSWLVDFDYTSLYPSIICSCNIGPNTCIGKIDSGIAIAYIYNQKKVLDEVNQLELRKNPMNVSSKTERISLNDFDKWIQSNEYIVTASGRIFKNHKEELSFLYKILRYLLDCRKKYKNVKKEYEEKKDEEKTKYYDNIQLAYKILANSMYGVLANSSFRFFSHDLAMSITLTGQEAIKFLGYHVGIYMKNKKIDIDPYFMDDFENKDIPYLAYGDTDSIFLQMGDWLIDNKVI